MYRSDCGANAEAVANAITLIPCGVQDSTFGAITTRLGPAPLNCTVSMAFAARSVRGMVSMIASDLQQGVERLGDLIAAASVIVPFTGAGISTECGIPDFRSPGGLWTRNRPIPYDEFVASQDARDESWRRRFAMEPTFAAATPERGHRALASLYRAGKIPAVITQNIDNLHQNSGFAAEHVIELHGNTTYA